jgi:preprotein translocase subunit SecG
MNKHGFTKRIMVILAAAFLMISMIIPVANAS